jgi:hypothetical protein
MWLSQKTYINFILLSSVAQDVESLGGTKNFPKICASFVIFVNTVYQQENTVSWFSETLSFLSVFTHIAWLFLIVDVCVS